MSRKREIRRCARSAEVETASSFEIRNFSFLCGTAFGELSTSRCSSLTHKAERFTLVQQQRGWRLGETAPYGNALSSTRRSSKMYRYRDEETRCSTARSQFQLTNAGSDVDRKLPPVRHRSRMNFPAGNSTSSSSVTTCERMSSFIDVAACCAARFQPSRSISVSVQLVFLQMGHAIIPSLFS